MRFLSLAIRLSGMLLPALLLVAGGCAAPGFSEGYASLLPADPSVEMLDRCSLSRPAVRVPAELMLFVEQDPYTASRIAMARAGGIPEVDISQAAVTALESEAARLASQTLTPLTDAFDIVVPVPEGYSAGPAEISGRLRFEAVPVPRRQLPVLTAYDDYLELHYRFVQMSVQLSLFRGGKPLGDIRTIGVVFNPENRPLKTAIRDSGKSTSEALCLAMRQLVVKFRRSPLFATVGGQPLLPAASPQPRLPPDSE